MNNELVVMTGKHEEFIEGLQEKYRIAKEEARNLVDEYKFIKDNISLKEQSFASWLIDRNSFPVVLLYSLFAVVFFLLFFNGLIH